MPHTLYHRPTFTAKPVRIESFPAYLKAVEAGYLTCNHGTWWVDSPYATPPLTPHQLRKIGIEPKKTLDTPD